VNQASRGFSAIVVEYNLSYSEPIYTARSSYASAVLGIVIPSVCLSVTRVLCDETNEHTAEILTQHEWVRNLVFWYQNRLVGDVPVHVKFALTVTYFL